MVLPNHPSPSSISPRRRDRRPCYIQRLPPQVLSQHVLPYLGYAPVLLRVRLVCRAWYIASSRQFHNDYRPAAMHQSLLSPLMLPPLISRVELAMPALIVATGFDTLTSKLYVITRGDGGGPSRSGSVGSIPQDQDLLLYEHDVMERAVTATDSMAYETIGSPVTSTNTTTNNTTFGDPQSAVFTERHRDRKLQIIPYDLGHLEEAHLCGPVLVCTSRTGEVFAYDCRTRNRLLVPTGTTLVTVSNSGNHIAAVIHEDVCMLARGEVVCRSSSPAAAAGGSGRPSHNYSQSTTAPPRSPTSNGPHTPHQWGGDALTALRQFSLRQRPQMKDVVHWLSTPGMMPERPNDESEEANSRLVPAASSSPPPSIEEEEVVDPVQPLTVSSHSPFTRSDSLVSVVVTDAYLVVVEEPFDGPLRTATCIQWISLTGLFGDRNEEDEEEEVWKVAELTLRCDRRHPCVVAADDSQLLLVDVRVGTMFIVDLPTGTVRSLGLPSICRGSMGVVRPVPNLWTSSHDIWCLTATSRNQRELVFISDDGTLFRRIAVPYTGHIAAHPIQPLVVLASDNPEVLQHPLLQAIEGGIGTVMYFPPHWAPAPLSQLSTSPLGSRSSSQRSLLLRGGGEESLVASGQLGDRRGCWDGTASHVLDDEDENTPQTFIGTLLAVLDRKWVLLSLILVCIIVISVSLLWTSLTLIYSGWWLHMQQLIVVSDFEG